MSRKWTGLGIAALALVALIGWRVVVKNTQEAELKRSQEARKNAAASVTLATVEPRDIVQTLDLVASLETPYDVKLSSKTAGRISFLDVREGQAVKAGQVLVRLDPTELEGQVLQQAASVAEAQAKLTQAQLGMAGNDTQVAAGVQQQRAAVSSAAANLDQARKSQAARAQAQDALVADAEGRLEAAKAQERSARTDLNTAKATLSNASAKLERVMSLYRQGFIAAQDVDDAKTAVAVQRNVVEAANEKVSAAHSAVASAEAQKTAAVKTATVNKRKDASDVEAARAQYTQARASLNVAGANRAQTKAYRENIASLRSSMQAAQAQLHQAQARRSDMILTSAIDGVVTNRAMDVGMVANTGQTILEIQYLKWLYAVASVPVDTGAMLRVGQPAKLTFDALPGKVYDATIALLNPAADPQSRQFRIQLRLDNSAGVLRPGMFGRISIATQQVHAKATVPREAIKGDSVYVVDAQGVAHKRQVTLGATDGAITEITSGVAPGETVVVLTYRTLKDGQKVRLPEGDQRK